MAISLEDLTLADLLNLHVGIGRELSRRGVCRTANNPVGDYTEWLVARALRLTLDGNSKKGYDASDTAGTRYQIKGRRLATPKAPPQLSMIRKLSEGLFQFLVGVIYDPDFRVVYAAQIPHAVVQKLAVFRGHTNGHVMHLQRRIFSEAGVLDITPQIQSQEAETSALTAACFAAVPTVG